MRMKIYSSSVILILLIVTLLLSGCVGGEKASNEEQIRVFLKSVENVYKELDAEKAANLYHYPIIIDEIEITKEDMKAVFHLLFKEFSELGVEILDAKIMLSDNNILIDSSGKYATIENAKLYLKMSINNEFVEDGTEDLGTLALMKVQGKWKFDGTMDPMF